MTDHPLKMVQHIKEMDLIAEALYECVFSCASITRWPDLPLSTRNAYRNQAREFIQFLETRT